MTITQMHDDDPSSLGATVARRVRGLLAEQGLKQEVLAPVLGVSPSSTSKRVRGLKPFEIDELPAVAQALDTSMEYLLGLTNDRSPRRITPGGGSMFVLPERTVGLSAALRACRDSNPKPSDLWPTVRRMVAWLGHLVAGGDRIAAHASATAPEGEEVGTGAVIIELPVSRIPAGDLPDEQQDQLLPERSRARLTVVS